jgi:hypothetical protein
MSDLGLDEHGVPVLFQAGPGVDVPTTRSGNPAHVPAGQPGGGRFGTRVQDGQGADGKTPPPVLARPTGTPANVDPAEWARRMDAVRAAAREFEQFSDQDIREFLKGRTNRELSESEIQAFLSDVRAQQLDDLVDVLDQNERGKLRSRRFVRVTAPRGYTRKTLNGLSDQELQSLVRRLRANGWNDKQVNAFAKRLPEKKQGILEGLSEEPGPLVIF